MFNFSVIALVSFVITLVLVVGGIFLFPKIGFMDKPAKYGLKRKPIPYYGGILIFLGFLISMFIFVEMSREIVGLLIGASMIVLVGFLDDYFDISPVVRLAVQIVAACVLVVFGVGILSITNPLGGVIVLDNLKWSFDLLDWHFVVPVLGGIFTIIWIVLITNTMNFLDGVAGLTSGVSFIAALTIFFLSVRPDLHTDMTSQLTVAVIALIVAFVSFAFLIFDFPKPKMLMGDTGSTLLGFLLASLAIFSGGKVATAFLVLGVPILDAAWVVLRRILSGKKPWQGDKKHLHHRLLDLGFKESTVLFIVYGLSVVFGLLAVFTSSSRQKLFVLVGLGILMVLFAVSIIYTSARAKKVSHKRG